MTLKLFSKMVVIHFYMSIFQPHIIPGIKQANRRKGKLSLIGYVVTSAAQY